MVLVVGSMVMSVDGFDCGYGIVVRWYLVMGMVSSRDDFGRGYSEVARLF